MNDKKTKLKNENNDKPNIVYTNKKTKTVANNANLNEEIHKNWHSNYDPQEKDMLMCMSMSSIINKKKEISVQQAIEVAKKSKMRCKHGAIIKDKNGNIIGSGFNKDLIGCRQRHSSHAEIIALNSVRNIADINGADLYVVRVDIDGNPIMSAPCHSCYKIMKKYMRDHGLRKVYFTT